MRKNRSGEDALKGEFRFAPWVGDTKPEELRGQKFLLRYALQWGERRLASACAATVSFLWKLRRMESRPTPHSNNPAALI
jgi:hypothetical protein